MWSRKQMYTVISFSFFFFLQSSFLLSFTGMLYITVLNHALQMHVTQYGCGHTGSHALDCEGHFMITSHYPSSHRQSRLCVCVCACPYVCGYVCVCDQTLIKSQLARSPVGD